MTEDRTATLYRKVLELNEQAAPVLALPVVPHSPFAHIHSAEQLNLNQHSREFVSWLNTAFPDDPTPAEVNAVFKPSIYPVDWSSDVQLRQYPENALPILVMKSAIQDLRMPLGVSIEQFSDRYRRMIMG